VWLTAAIGMACGAGLPRLAVAGTAGYLFVVLTYTPLVQRLPRAQSALAHLRLDYVDGRGVLREALMVCSAHGFTVGDLAVVRGETSTSRADATSAATAPTRPRRGRAPSRSR
jgi:putative Mg2+ transporter-C (MgtC) family protein